jgi:hypothetical protein
MLATLLETRKPEPPPTLAMARTAIPKCAVCQAQPFCLTFHVSLAELVYVDSSWCMVKSGLQLGCAVLSANDHIDIEGPKGDGGLARSALDCAALGVCGGWACVPLCLEPG